MPEICRFFGMLHLVFENQRHGIIDLANIICADHRPVFLELKDKEKFKRFRVDMDTVVWENGFDLAPEFLYEKLEDVQK